jgi:diketogulonate reductase-like aldo/keto reductase
MIRNLQDTVKLNNGINMPALGFGVFKVGDGKPVINAVRSALNLGYKSIDTAAVYGNERGVGEAIRESKIERESLFVTSKVWNDDQLYDSTLRAFDHTLEKLGFDYLDLYLIHWPVRGKYLETWRAMEDLYKQKRVKAIGVSNFQIEHLKDLLANSEIVPAVNQIELHPLLTQQKLREFCKLNNIVVEAWSPLMKGNLDLPLLKELSKKYNKTAAQIVLRWHLQNSIVAIPKSVHQYRIRENANIFDFTLHQEDMEALENLNENRRFGPDPDTFV